MGQPVTSPQCGPECCSPSNTQHRPQGQYVSVAPRKATGRQKELLPLNIKKHTRLSHACQDCSIAHAVHTVLSRNTALCM